MPESTAEPKDRTEGAGPKLEPGAVVASRYRLEERLSAGGMGSVWRAEHLQLKAPVAVKFMHGTLVEQAAARARFEREARAAAQIRSPFVVHVSDHGVDHGVPFLVMEYLEGEDLGRRLARSGGRLAPAEAVRICTQICKGLARAHALGIVHRDLKPGNVFLSALGDDMVKILDFGVAKETGVRSVAGETTTTGEIVGSPHYMSPEQCRAQPLDGRSDLWSLAVILYRMLTGARPFEGSDLGDIVVRICTEPPRKPSEHVPELRPEVDAFFERAFTVDREARFLSPDAFAHAFSEAVVGEAAVSASGEWDPRGSHPVLPRISLPSGPTPTAIGYGPEETTLRTPTEVSRTLTASIARRRSRRRLFVALALGAAAALAVRLISFATRGPAHDPAVPVVEPAPATPPPAVATAAASVFVRAEASAPTTPPSASEREPLATASAPAGQVPPAGRAGRPPASSPRVTPSAKAPDLLGY